MFKQVSPKTDFPSLEQELLKKWDKNKTIDKYLSRNKSSTKKFSFIDGPITANNPMGVHHAWGRTYKDLWQRFFNMLGYKQRFQNGFDEQGLWVEVEVEKELGLNTKKDIENLVKDKPFESIAKFVNLCKERVKKFSQVQTDQSKRLGYFMDWKNSYHTSSEQNNYAIWHYLKTVHEKNWLYKGRDSVPWCPRCGTAISQHEILTEEYKEVFHKSLYVKYPVKNQDFSLLIWTTTPWTLPGNVAVAINPDFEYVVWDLKGEKVLFASGAQERVYEALMETYKNESMGDLVNTKKVFKGKDLLGLKYQGPFDDLEQVKKAENEKPESFHTVIEAKDLVTAEEGTGLVHIAPGAGEEDFKLHQEFDLPVIELINEEANYLDSLGKFSNLNAKKHPDLIIEDLNDKELLFAQKNYKHRYPTCWRCKTELVWRVVDEWYIAVDRQDPEKKKTYREMMKDTIKEVKWIPKWGYDRELDWLNNLHDWLISKKRYWGLALPIWECEKCGNFDVIGSKEELKEKTIEGWKEFEGNSPHRPWVDQVKIKCSKCGEKTSRIPDVGNPWLDAGIVPYSTLEYFSDKKYWSDWFPADFITESFPGQFKNWFYSLIAMSTALEATTPFKTLLGHGSVRDEKGEEMHKSKGNAIWFEEAAEKMGVDVMRWLYLRNNPENNVNFGYKTADEVRRYFHIRLWNVYSFLVTYASLDKWQPKQEIFEPKLLIDKWILSRLSSLTITVQNHLKGFNALLATEEIENFVVNDLSNWYVRRIRDRVGPVSPPGEDKDQAYQTLWLVLSNLSQILAPFIPFIADSIYQNLTSKDSVHLSDWPKSPYLIDEELENQMKIVVSLSSSIHAKRKEANLKVRQPLAKAEYNGIKLEPELEQLIADETNVKKIVFNEKQKDEIVLDTEITPDLKVEGEVRDLIRAIQEARKEAGCLMNEIVEVTLPNWPKEFEVFIKRETIAKNLVKGPSIKIQRLK